MRTTLRSTILVAALSACHSSAPAPSPEPEASASRDGSAPVVTLERTPCFGSCPVYSLSVSRSGVVRFDGKKFVRHTGPDSAKISAAGVDSLLAEISAAGYYDFEERYTSGAPACGRYATDLPSVITSVTDGSRSRRIQHDRGCSDAPPALSRLESRIDEVAGTARWIGR
jgi:hypothetical protein